MFLEAAASNPAVTGAIRHAARMTGANFQYLLATAQVESNFNPNAAPATSSARGLFQFIEQTWLATLKEQGGALGYARYADAIAQTPSGQYAVTDARLQDKILNLRSDPTANAVMAGAFTKTNAAKLTEALGRKPTEGELYIAHFLGPAGASKLIGLAAEAPRTRAAEVFPAAARANPQIFYGKHGARSVADVYGMLVGRYDSARAPSRAPAAVAQKPAAPERPAFAPDTSSLAEAYAGAARISAAKAQMDPGPMFHSLFRSSEREPVAPVVSALWGAQAANPPRPIAAAPVPVEPSAAQPVAEPRAITRRARAPAVAEQVTPAMAEGPAPRAAGGLDLFQDSAPDPRSLFRGRV
jgi:hypothetical protein